MAGEAFWRPTSTVGGASSFDDLTDVDMTTVAPTDGQVPVFDDSDDTWKPGTVSAASSAYGFRAYRSTAQSLGAATFTAVVFDTEVIDEGGHYNNANGEWTVPETGWWLVGGGIRFDNASAGTQLYAAIFVNGSEHSRLTGTAPGSTMSANLSGSIPLYLTSGDVVTLRGYRSAGGNAGGFPTMTYFTAAKMP